MEEEKQAAVPYFVHEGTMARMERVFKITVIALVAALAVAVCSLIANDIMWRQYCNALEERYTTNAEVPNGVYQQSDSESD